MNKRKSLMRDRKYLIKSIIENYKYPVRSGRKRMMIKAFMKGYELGNTNDSLWVLNSYCGTMPERMRVMQLHWMVYKRR